MTANMRYGNKWSVNELLSLQREYELLEWSVQEIAAKHRRSVNAILFKLEAEGFINSWNEARGFNLKDIHNEDFNLSDVSETKTEDSLSVSSEYENEEFQNTVSSHSQTTYNDVNNDVNNDLNNVQFTSLSERVWNLEASVSEIGALVKQMFNVVVGKQTNELINC